PARSAAARAPRTVPSRRQEAQDLPPARSEPGRGSRTARRVGWLLALLLVVVVIAVVVVLALHPSAGSVVQDKRVIANDWRSAVDQVQRIISTYTR
ncbi:MAG: hypothetical protein KGL16_07605, partial [Acidobacteriota bacterium]|nr:hypothetical protein [Acidobacteriota bacterium]